MDASQLKAILAKHAAWRRGEKDGERANLASANLSGADLSGASLAGANLYRANLSGADLPLSMTIEDWCDAHDLATLPDGRRIAFKRLDKSMTTGTEYGFNVTWKRRSYVEAADWNDTQECGGGLHLSPTPTTTRSYSDGEVCVPVAFAYSDAVHIGDKLKVRKCQVL